jgi:tRNA/tmRNA/rRNA uracil-C5-methylase (TrmA/RlmC/RlmD family)
MQIEIKIERLAYGGEGIGYADGKVCFVEGALPGEKVLAHVTQDKKKFVRARAVKILTPSEKRVSPPCPIYEACGGCQYQHVEYSEELRWKEIQVREYLQKNLKIDSALVQPAVGSSEAYGYRSSVTLHQDKNGTVGFIGRDNETVVAVPHCLLADPRLAPAFQNPGFEKGEKSKTFRLAGSGRIYSSHENEFYEMAAGEKTALTHSKGFFQNNLFMTAAIGKKIKGWVDAVKPELFLDLFSGAGAFSLLAADSARRIVCMEDNPYSIQALEKMKEAGRLSAEIVKGRVEDALPRWLQTNTVQGAFILVDPPRMGMSEGLSKLLSRQGKAASLIYLSCHLGTLTRDLGLILGGGQFEVAEAVPFDMFPRTKHIEVLVRLNSFLAFKPTSKKIAAAGKIPRTSCQSWGLKP